MSLREKQSRFWLMIAEVIRFAKSEAIPIVPLQVWRSEQEQKALVARGASKTMNSLHLQGLALDFVFLGDLQDDGIINWDKANPQYYRMIGQFWENLDPENVWGGRWNETPEKLGWDSGHLQYGR